MGLAKMEWERHCFSSQKEWINKNGYEFWCGPTTWQVFPFLDTSVNNVKMSKRAWFPLSHSCCINGKHICA